MVESAAFETGKPMLIVLFTAAHIVVCVFLIAVVLLQTGKRADLAGAFGGGGSGTAFGARGAATFLSKATTIAAAIFMVTCLALSVLASRRSGGGTVLDDVKVPAAPSSQPAAPAQAPAQVPGSSPTPLPESK